MPTKVKQWLLVCYWVLLTLAACIGHANKVGAIMAGRTPDSDLSLLGFFIVGILLTFFFVNSNEENEDAS